MSLTNTYCTNDFLEINGVMGSCNAPNNVLNQRLCGEYFGASNLQTRDADFVCGMYDKIANLARSFSNLLI